MKKYQKWLVFFMALIPLIVITVILSFYEIDTSLSVTVMVCCSILFALSIIAFAQRKKIKDSLVKRRRILLAVMGVYSLFLFIMYYVYEINIWEIFSSNVLSLVQFIVLIAIVLFGFFYQPEIKSNK